MVSLSSELDCLVTSLAGSLSVNLSPLVLCGFPLHCETYLVVQSTGPSLGVQAEQKMGKKFLPSQQSLSSCVPTPWQMRPDPALWTSGWWAFGH